MVIDYLGYGGAIGTNGLLEIGEVSESVVMLKHWKSDAEAIRPSYADFLNNWVTLKQNGEAYTAFGKFTLSHIVPDTENKTETAYLNVENDPFVLAEVLYNRTAKTWRITIDGLPLLPDVQKAWSIEEKTSAGEGYKGTPVTPPGTGIDYEITNEAVITISGKKVWKNDTEADRPESVTIHLYQEGVEEEIGHTTAQAPDWTWRFTDLPEYDNNEEEIQYIIEERAVDNYGHVERTREEDGTWTITNTHTEGQTILEVRKAWEDNEHYKDMFRPESVTVQLLRFDRETETWIEVPDAVLTLNHGNAWEGIFEYLQEYEEIDGRPVRVQYSVAEIDAPEGYTVTGPFGDMTDGFEITNTEITTVEVPVRKVWSDPNSAHAAVTVILDPAGAELTLSEENGWAGTFTDLPKYDREGMLIQYSVRELRVPGYTTEIRFDRETGEFVITNNRNGEKPKGPQFFVIELPELPKTGFSAVRPTALAEQPLSLRYALSGMTLEIPSLAHQNRVASILSAYDDLIENNQKQIKLLEEAVQRLYKEWFVDLHFPGYENCEIVDGVPEGWRRYSLENVIEFNPKMSFKKDSKKISVPMAALNTSCMVLDKTHFVQTTSNSGSKFKNGDTLLARITPCLENGKTGFAYGLPEEGAVGSTEFIVMRSKLLNPYMVYLFARTDSFRRYAINSMTGSDGRQRAQVDKLRQLCYILPEKNIIESFGMTVEPLFKEIYVLQNQSSRATEARDRLLPKLMSGEIEV